jgi:hypothetical protein
VDVSERKGKPNTAYVEQSSIAFGKTSFGDAITRNILTTITTEAGAL